MADSKKFTGWQDHIRVDGNDPSEVEYFHQQHRLFSHEEITAAIKAAGPYRKDIEEYLKKNTPRG